MTIRYVATVAVSAVALVAAIVSYEHMRTVALAAGEDWRSWLLPISVDGQVVAATLTAWQARRAGRRIAFMTKLALAVGLLVSVAANAGVPYLPESGTVPAELSAAVAAWPPLALALAAEELLRLHHMTRPRPAAELEPGRAAMIAERTDTPSSVRQDGPDAPREIEDGKPRSPMPADGPGTAVRSGGDGSPSILDISDLLEDGKAVAGELGDHLTRNTLVEAMRKRGHRLSSGRGSA